MDVNAIARQQVGISAYSSQLSSVNNTKNTSVAETDELFC